MSSQGRAPLPPLGRPVLPVRPLAEPALSARARRGWTLAGILAAAVAVALTLTFAPGLRHGGWLDWVRHRPASFTEVALIDPANPPRTFVPGGTVGVPLDVVNHRETAAALDYAVVVTDRTTGAQTLARRGTVSLGPGSGTRLTVPVSVTVRDPVRVAVQFEGGAAVSLLLEPAP